MRRWEAKVTPTSYAFIFFQCITSEAVSKIVTKQLSLCFGNRNSPLTPHTSCVTCACRIIDFRSDSVLWLAAGWFHFHSYNFDLVFGWYEFQVFVLIWCLFWCHYVARKRVFFQIREPRWLDGSLHDYMQFGELLLCKYCANFHIDCSAAAASSLPFGFSYLACHWQ